MEKINILQEKIEFLLEVVRDLKEKNAKLFKDCEELQQKLCSITSSQNQVQEQAGLLTEEKKRTKIIVEDLIKSIDSFTNADI